MGFVSPSMSYLLNRCSALRLLAYSPPLSSFKGSLDSRVRISSDRRFSDAVCLQCTRQPLVLVHCMKRCFKLVNETSILVTR